METMRGNVGRRPHRHCRNLTEDQTTVMTLLSRIPEDFGGAPGKLNFIVRPGYCADDLYNAILKFQERAVHTLSKPDGIVSPSGATLMYLNRLADLHLPVKKLTDDKQYQLMLDMYYDESSKIYSERANANAPEYLRKKEREKQTAADKWRKWKEQIKKDSRGNLYSKLTIDYLDDEQKKSGTGTDIAFLPWAVGFGEAYIGYDYTPDWTKKLMWSEVLLSAYDKRKLILSTHGVTAHSPIILFGNFTHYVMKLPEVVEFTFPT